jgi:hypothetical protein
MLTGLDPPPGVSVVLSFWDVFGSAAQTEQAAAKAKTTVTTQRIGILPSIYFCSPGTSRGESQGGPPRRTNQMRAIART